MAAPNIAERLWKFARLLGGVSEERLDLADDPGVQIETEFGYRDFPLRLAEGVQTLGNDMDDTFADARRMIERSRQLIQTSRAAIEDGRNHIVKSEENIADAQRLLAPAKVKSPASSARH